MDIYRVTELTHREWVFGPALKRVLRQVSQRNPEAQVITASIRVDDTIWEWTFKDNMLKKGEQNDT